MLIAFSGLVNDEVRQKAAEVGFKQIIEAPLTQQKIKDFIHKALKDK